VKRPTVRIIRNSVQCLLILTAALALAAEPNWKTKPPAQWNEADAKQLLGASPWAKIVEAAVYRAPTEDQLRDGGRMGQPQGIGYKGVPNNGPKLQDLTTKDLFRGGANPEYAPPAIPLLVRWESALPVRMAELKSADGGLDGIAETGYAVSVSGLPGGYFEGDPKKLGQPLKQQAFLKREGKKDVAASSVEVYVRAEGVVVVYIFPLSAEITKKDQFVTFQARIGRIGLSIPFSLAGMDYQGKLEL